MLNGAVGEGRKEDFGSHHNDDDDVDDDVDANLTKRAYVSLRNGFSLLSLISPSSKVSHSNRAFCRVLGVIEGLRCANGPAVRPVRTGCYSWAALSLIDSKTLNNML